MPHLRVQSLVPKLRQRLHPFHQQSSPAPTRSSNEASFERPATDPSFADLLDRYSSVLSGHRNLPLVRRPLVATGTGPTIRTGPAIGLLSFPNGTFETCRRALRMSGDQGWSQPVDATLYLEGEMECSLMVHKFHRGFTTAEKTELWDRWKRGESLKATGRAFGKQSSSIYFLVAPHGGIRPAERRRGIRAPVANSISIAPGPLTPASGAIRTGAKPTGVNKHRSGTPTQMSAML
jgi:hypothetical protein